MYKIVVLLCICVGLSSADFVFNDTIFMPHLDRQITKDMLEPQPEGGPKLLQESFYFYQNMNAAADLIAAKDKRGEEVYLDLMRDGGPHFIKRRHDDPLMRQVFKWGPDEMEEFEAILGAAEKAWNVLEKNAIAS